MRLKLRFAFESVLATSLLQPLVNDHFQERLITDPLLLRQYPRLGEIRGGQAQSDWNTARSLQFLHQRGSSRSFRAVEPRLPFDELASGLARPPFRFFRFTGELGDVLLLCRLARGRIRVQGASIRCCRSVAELA